MHIRLRCNNSDGKHARIQNDSAYAESFLFLIKSRNLDKLNKKEE